MGVLKMTDWFFLRRALAPTFSGTEADGGTGMLESAVSQAQRTYLLFNFCQGLDGDSQEIKRLHLKIQTKSPLWRLENAPCSYDNCDGQAALASSAPPQEWTL